VMRQSDVDHSDHALRTPSHQSGVCREHDGKVVCVTCYCFDTTTGSQPTVDNGSFEQVA